MTQELIDLRNSITEGRYTDALAIVDELEGISKKAIIRQIKSFIKILLIHLIKNQIEQRLTNSWAASMRYAILEIQDVNLKDTKKSYYVNENEWQILIEDQLTLAIGDASLEVLNGNLKRQQISQMLNQEQLLLNTTELLTMTYNYANRELPDIIDNYLAKLPGGEDWING
ncbi:hypothetical protein [Anabaena azotica]|uniref:hypothetical protein n=1 Tax=Anabaena azotica TaxID=197653 RepID=UPI0039A776C7